MPVMIVCQFKGKARGGLGSEFQLLDDILEFTSPLLFAGTLFALYSQVAILFRALTLNGPQAPSLRRTIDNRGKWNFLARRNHWKYLSVTEIIPRR